MRRSFAGFASTLLLGLLSGCAAGPAGQGGWIALIDGQRGLDNFNRTGNANWRAEDGAVVADRRTGADPAYLVTRVSYRDFSIRAEVWVSQDANSGIFIRCANPAQISDESCYEANLFDQRPDPTYGTGAIVRVAKVSPMPKAGGRWNVMEVTARGPRLTVVLNGQTTVEVDDGRLTAGPIALQYGAGVVKWRRVEVRSF